MLKRLLILLLAATVALPAAAQIPGGGSIVINQTPVQGGTITQCLYITPAGRVGAQACSGGGGSGTVTVVSVVTANGVSGSVANATTTPAITLTLGAITPSSVTATGAIIGYNATAIPAGGTTGSGLKFSSTANYGVFFGSGAPTLSAAQGSLYLRSDGLPYFNTNGTTGWTVLGTGTGTVNSGTAGQLTYYAGSGTAVSGNANLTVSSGALTIGVAGSQAGTLLLSGGTSGAVTLAAPATAGSGTLTFPAATDTVALLAATQTFTNKTLTAPTIAGATISGVANFTGTFEIGGNQMTFPTGPATLTYAGGTFAAGECVQTNGTSGELVTTGSACGSGGGGTPGGANTNVQYNNSGSFGGNSGFTYNGTSAVTLGVAGTSVGSVGFRNATSGTVTLQPVTGALGTVTLSLPAATDTLMGKATTDTMTNKTFDTAGTGNAFAINGTSITAVTGTGSVVLATAPTIAGVTVSGTANFTGTFQASGNTITLPGAVATLIYKTTSFVSGECLQASGTAGAIVTTGAACGGSGSVPGGSDTNVQFNDSSNFGGNAGFVYDKTSKISLGVAGASVGSIGFNNATSGQITLAPATGALGTVTLTLPIATDTLVGRLTTDTFTNKTYDTAGTGNSFLINGVAVTANTGTGAVARAASPTFTGTVNTAALIATGTVGVVSASSSSLVVGPNGGTNPVLQIDSSAGSQAAGLKITGAATGGTVALAAIDSGSNTNVSLDGKGSGTITIAGTSTGGITLGRAITYGGVTLSNAVTGTGNMVLSASPTFTGTVTMPAVNVSGAVAITSASANSFDVGPNGTTNPVLQIDSSTSSQAAGLKVTGAGSGGTVAIAAIDSGSNTSLSIDGKGSGTITLGASSTGAITLTRATTMSGALTYGGVTLSNAVTGTGAMALANTPTLITPVIGAATGTSLTATGVLVAFSGTAIPAGGTAGSGLRFSSTSNYGVFFGSGSPTLAAAQGSLYLRSDGVPYYNTDGNTAWSALGSGSGTVNSGTGGRLAWYSSTGTTIDGNANLTISSGALTVGVAGSTAGTVLISGSASGTTTLAVASAASGTLTLPAATDTLVGRATTDTLSNKTLTTPTISSGGATFTGSTSGTTVLAAAATASGTVTLPTGGTLLSTTAGQTIAAGFTYTSYSGGTVSSGTYTPTCANGNYQYITNNGAFTMAAPSANCAIQLLITNGASAGAITFSGYTVGSSTGDALTTTNTSKFLLTIVQINSVATYLVKALQ